MLVLLLLLLLLLLSVIGITPTDDSDPNEFVVSAYLPDYRFDSLTHHRLNRTKLTDLVLFSMQPDFECCLQETAHFQVVQQARRAAVESNQKPWRVWLTIGGAGRSQGFITELFPQTNNNIPKTRFFKKILRLARNYDLYGIDIDCEQFRTQTDYHNYAQWIQQAAEAFHTHNLRISIALHPQQTMPVNVYRAVDRIHLMTYELSQQQQSQHQRAVETLIASGCPPSKIVLGIPAYARHAHTQHVLSVAEIVDRMGGIDATRTEWNGYVFESKQSIRNKVNYARRKGLRGVFLWELGQDKITTEYPSGYLVEAMADSDGVDPTKTEF